MQMKQSKVKKLCNKDDKTKAIMIVDKKLCIKGE